MNKDTLKTHEEKFEDRFNKFIDNLPSRVGETPRSVLKEFVQSEREQAIKERDGYWKDIIMKKLYNMDTCNDVNEIFNLMDKLKK
jgi:hypothetical protein